ncbi:MAG: hypothetical protein AB7S93_07115 [Xanthobacteraceae bacterium]
MLHDLMRASSIALLIAASPAARAQAEPPQGSPPKSLSSPGREAEAEKAMQTPPGKAGKEEPSSHTPTAPPVNTIVLMNGVLAVPGAPRDTDTTPSKYSAQNAADDKLITLAYTFKTLPNDQRQAIYQALEDQPPVTGLNTQIGTALPFTVATQVVPDRLVARVPATQGFHFAVSGERVLLIAPANRVVVGVFTGDGDATTGRNDTMR